MADLQHISHHPILRSITVITLAPAIPLAFAHLLISPWPFVPLGLIPMIVSACIAATQVLSIADENVVIPRAVLRFFVKASSRLRKPVRVRIRSTQTPGMIDAFVAVGYVMFLVPIWMSSSLSFGPMEAVVLGMYLSGLMKVNW